MIGPYKAKENYKISYTGNKLFENIDSINGSRPRKELIENRVKNIGTEEMWHHISEINNRINLSSNLFFSQMNSLFTLLPLTTRMISSPGAVYGKEKIDYTSDTSPITLNWFDQKKKVFLSESSQLYLELSLTQKEISSVYSIYNSFRKEKADETHLSEFHHIEFEGKVNAKENEDVAIGLLKRILDDLIKHNKKNLEYFLSDEKIEELISFKNNIFDIPRITFKEALELLYKETKNEKYKTFTSKHFGDWEEIKLTEIFQNMVLIREYPLLEVPFYHDPTKNRNPQTANNFDIIWPGYREIIGGGLRIANKEVLEEKAKIFNLPKEDYEPYLYSRSFSNYCQTSGFGLGWERLLQAIIETPYIWTASHFPRIDKTLKP